MRKGKHSIILQWHWLWGDICTSGEYE